MGTVQGVLSLDESPNAVNSYTFRAHTSTHTDTQVKPHSIIKRNGQKCSNVETINRKTTGSKTLQTHTQTHTLFSVCLCL